MIEVLLACLAFTLVLFGVAVAAVWREWSRHERTMRAIDNQNEKDFKDWKEL